MAHSLLAQFSAAHTAFNDRAALLDEELYEGTVFIDLWISHVVITANLLRMSLDAELRDNLDRVSGMETCDLQ